MTKDEQRERARQLGSLAAAAGLSEDDNPYSHTHDGLSEIWASGFATYVGALQVVRFESDGAMPAGRGRWSRIAA